MSYSLGTISGELESSIKFILELYCRMISLTQVSSTVYVVSTKFIISVILDIRQLYFTRSCLIERIGSASNVINDK